MDLEDDDVDSTLFIADKLKVGFQKRDDTYTGQLAYVIYFDKKGVLRKEKSWESWRDKKLPAKEFENVPTDGFVLNKKVGGHRSHWNYRDAHVRVYDPRGFEFEISVPNLLFILRENACNPGKGLEGKYVYAWEGTELVLLPTNSEEYVKSSSFSELQGQQVKAKDLVPGAVCTTKDQQQLTFVGKLEYFYVAAFNPYRKADKVDSKGKLKKWIFWDGKEYRAKNDIKNIATMTVPVGPNPEFANILDGYLKGPHGSAVKKLFLKHAKVEKKTDYREEGFYIERDGKFIRCDASREYNRQTNKHDGPYTRIVLDRAYYVKDGKLCDDGFQGRAFPDGQKVNRYHGAYYRDTYNDNYFKQIPWFEPTEDRLYAEMESGSTLRVTNGLFDKDY